MEIFEEIKSSLNENEYLTSELKEDIKGLITDFHRLLPEFDLIKFNDKIKNLNIIAGNKYVLKDIVKYDSLRNILYINKLELDAEDGKYILMLGLMYVITDNGINRNGNFETLNFGINDMIANYIAGSEVNG